MTEDETPARVHGETIIAPGFIWYCIPKNASRSLQATLLPHGRPIAEAADGMTSRDWLLTQEARFSFGFVRNPYDRIVSVWRNKVLNPPDTPGQAAMFKRWCGLHRGMPLNEFVAFIAAMIRNGVGCDNHWRPQYQFVCNPAEDVCARIYKIEDFTAGMADLSDRLGIKLTIERRNSTLESGREKLSPAARHVITDLYALDFELFGYRTGR